MSKVEIDGVEYECPPEVAGLLQAVSEERDELQGSVAQARSAQRKPDPRNAAQPDKGVAHGNAGLGIKRRP